MAILNILGGVALIPDPHWVWFIVGCVVAVGSGLVGLGMSAAGFGVDRGGGLEGA